MKFIKLFLLAILFCNFLNAQTDPIRNELDQIFQHIDKSQVPTGYLDEYGAQFTDKTYNTGVLSDNNVVRTITHFNFMYSDVQTAKIYLAAQDLPSIDQVNEVVKNAEANALGTTPLIFFVGGFSTLKEDALNNGLFTKSGNQIFDVAGRTESPYIATNFFIVCPIQEKSSEINRITLSYNASLAFSNLNKTISSVSIDFLEGSGYEWLDPDLGSISPSYSDSSGFKKFAILVQCTDGSSYECYSGQYVTVKQPGILSRFSTFTDAELASPRISFSNTASPAHNGNVYVRYSTKRTGSQKGKMVKPFIIVEGYDIHDVADKLKEKNYDVNKLLEEWNDLYKKPSDFDFNGKLDEEGLYDLVFVDYFTMDGIPDNANLIQKVIEWVNQEKAKSGSTEKNVVIGISMGGLVSRYCLAQMTRNAAANSYGVTDYRNPQTRLLITR